MTVLSYTVGVIASQDSFQSAPPASQKTMTLNVLVVDKQNRPITDLKREDFQLLEDETMQSISFFSTEPVPNQATVRLAVF